MNRSGPEKPRRWHQLGIASSAVYCVVISSCLLVQPDWLAPVILVPPWCWLISGLALTASGCRRNHKLRLFGVLALWSVFTALFVEEAQSLVRSERRPTAKWQMAREHAHAIRVVSLNCNVGQSRSVEELIAWNPDIVLLQESPSRERLEHLSRAIFGTEGVFLHGGDVSIAARGRIHPKFSDPRSFFVHAGLELSSGLALDVISVRLTPPVFRLDFYARGFWGDHRNRRIEHKEQILDVMEQVRSVPVSSYLILGGDFNLPPYDHALAPLRRRLFETFSQAGHGWGATGTNDFPLFRVDQIWASHGFQAESVTAQKTLYSDHRMVVCDLILKTE